MITVAVAILLFTLGAILGALVVLAVLAFVEKYGWAFRDEARHW